MIKQNSFRRFVLSLGATIVILFTIFVIVTQSHLVKTFVFGFDEDEIERVLVIKAQTGDHKFTYELADDEDEQARGLMHRKTLDQDHGMLFLYSDEKERFMWMKNTYISLDMLFIDAKGTVVHIQRNVQPLSDDIITSKFPVAAVFEINGGYARNLGLFEGDKVEW